MKVLNLRCAVDHRFEGWFASDDEWSRQRESGRVECPMCGNTAIERLPSAPRVKRSASREPAPESVDLAKPDELQAQWLRAMRHLLAHTEDVGDRFADEARRIHYGEAENRGIRGRASAQESEALAAEGIEVMPLPLPPVLKEPLQ